MVIELFVAGVKGSEIYLQRLYSLSTRSGIRYGSSPRWGSADNPETPASPTGSRRDRATLSLDRGELAGDDR